MGLEPRQIVWAQTSAANMQKEVQAWKLFFFSFPFFNHYCGKYYISTLLSPSPPYFPSSVGTSYIFLIGLTPVLGPSQMGKDRENKNIVKAGPVTLPKLLFQAINQLLGTSENFQNRGHTFKNLCGTDRSQKSDKPGIMYQNEEW